MTKAEQQAKRLMELFKGLDRARGRYVVTGKGEGGKTIGQASVVRGGPTLGHWMDHLSGKTGLGIIPITAQNNAHWGVIDIDRYDIPEQIAEIAEKLGQTPLIPVRSKSGGLHVFVFCKEGVKATLMRKRLHLWASRLGFGGVELFPKQTRLVSEDDVGNWLNMPYFDAKKTERYSIGPEGAVEDLDTFLARAESASMTPAKLAKFSLKIQLTSADDAHLQDGPPCLQHLIKMGFPSGTRNNGLFALGVYYRKAAPDAWEDRVRKANEAFLKPPLVSAEVDKVIKSLGKKTYAYMCSEPPLCDHCDKATCSGRRFGANGLAEESLPTFGGLTKVLTRPPTYYLDIGENRLGPLGSEDLMQQSRFQKACVDELNLYPPTLTAGRWRQIVQDMLNEVQQITVPDDSTGDGLLMEQLEDFCTGARCTDVREEVLIGRAWPNTEQEYHFRLSAFIEYLSAKRYHTPTPRELAALFHQRGVIKRGISIRKRFVNTWVFKPGDDPIEIPAHEPEKEAF